MDQESIRVLIVDDVAQVRQGLATMLKLATKNSSPRIEVVGEAINGSEAIRQAQALHPDAILMDLEMPVLDGYEATRRIKAAHPAMRVIILSIHAGPDEQGHALMAGADAFIEKSAPLDGLVKAIQNLRKVNFDKELL